MVSRPTYSFALVHARASAHSPTGERGTRAAGRLLGSAAGLRLTLWVAVIGGVAGAALLVPSPLPRFRLPG
jgi:hypothetical protein